VRQPRAGQAPERDEREPQAVERERAAGGVEAAVVQRLAAREQRVLGGRVDLHREDVVQRGQRPGERAGHRRQAAQAERVLTADGRLGAGGERAQTRGDELDPRQRARLGDGVGERLAVAAQRLEAERGDGEAGLEQVPHVGQDERGGRVRGGVGAHQRQRVARSDLQVRGAAFLTLAGQREPELGQHRKVAGPQPAEVAHGRHPVRGQQLGQRDGDLGAAPASGGHLREPHQHGRAHHVLGQRLAEAAGVAAQQPQRVLAEVADDVHVPVGPDARRAAVDGAVRRDRLGRGMAGRHPLARGRGELDVHRPAAGRRRQRRGRERLVTDPQPQLSSAVSWRSSVSSPTSRTSSGSPSRAAARSAAARVAAVGRWASQSTRV
jgi:hypothetical protein